MVVLIPLIDILFTVLTLLVIAHVILSWFMSPYHPVRETVDTIVNPMLNPIRSVMPRMGMLDFSPIVLIILFRILRAVLIQLLLTI
jgi:YggT family protein